jgi:hypothetical protein
VYTLGTFCPPACVADSRREDNPTNFRAVLLCVVIRNLPVPSLAHINSTS